MRRAKRIELAVMSISLVAFGLFVFTTVQSAEGPMSPQCEEKTDPCKQATSADLQQFTPIFPPHQAVLLSGQVDLICKAAEPGGLDVEGEIIDWEPFRPPLRVARLNLYNGRNQIKIGPKQLDLFVAKDKDDPGIPDGWKIYRRHPISGHGSKRCAACHQVETSDGQPAVGDLKPQKACFKCHDPADLKGTCAHELDSKKPCQSCHALHTSTHEMLLKDMLLKDVALKDAVLKDAALKDTALKDAALKDAALKDAAKKSCDECQKP